MVEEFQKAIDGHASGEPWCAGFVGFCLKKVESQYGIKSQLILSESCLTMWEKNKNRQVEIDPKSRFQRAKVGMIPVWKKKNTRSGHTGIYVREDGKNIEYFYTIEGNTHGGEGLVREGDGVFERHRYMGAVGDFLLLGFLDPWK